MPNGKISTFIPEDALGVRDRWLLVANWKAESTLEATLEWLNKVDGLVQEGAFERTAIDVVLTPPTPLLSAAAATIDRLNRRWIGDVDIDGGEEPNLSISLGCQGLDAINAPTQTAAVSPTVLRDLGCMHTLVGHSERRQRESESGPTLQHQVNASHALGITPVLCVGETREERQAGQSTQVVMQQVDQILDQLEGQAAGRVGSGAPLQFDNSFIASTIIAYEPLWAIDSGETPTPQEINEIASKIRSHVHYDRCIEGILYGGSVSAENIGWICKTPSLSGVLIGGASHQPEQIAAMCQQLKERRPGGLALKENGGNW